MKDCPWSGLADIRYSSHDNGGWTFHVLCNVNKDISLVRKSYVDQHVPHLKKRHTEYPVHITHITSLPLIPLPQPVLDYHNLASIVNIPTKRRNPKRTCSSKRRWIVWKDDRINRRVDQDVFGDKAYDHFEYPSLVPLCSVHPVDTQTAKTHWYNISQRFPQHLISNNEETTLGHWGLSLVELDVVRRRTRWAMKWGGR